MFDFVKKKRRSTIIKKNNDNHKNMQSTFKLKITVCRACIAIY